LGFQRAGMVCKWQVEIDEYANRVLQRHWPNVRRHDDVRTWPQPDTESVDVICGGFPCQDISAANHKGQGLQGSRSGLWSEYARTIREVRPKIVCIENVAAITFRGLQRVLWDLARCGFDAEWQTLPAQAFGAPHRRDRVFIVAYRAGERLATNEVFDHSAFKAAITKQAERVRCWPGERKRSAALPDRFRWVPHGELCRVVNGVPDGLDRYRCLGNAIVPHVAEWIGRRLMLLAGRTPAIEDRTSEARMPALVQ
jgi:DNA (cytosine-5)-methyltransferase 1